jgi:hypothetical protein
MKRITLYRVPGPVATVPAMDTCPPVALARPDSSSAPAQAAEAGPPGPFRVENPNGR